MEELKVPKTRIGICRIENRIKMNKREFFFFAALAVVISCAKETGYQEESEIVSSVEMVFTASRDAET